MVTGTTVEGAALASAPLSAWDQTGIVIAGTTCEGVALVSVGLFGVGSDSDGRGEHDSSGRCSGF